ncbi:hypothetical protein ACOMHN_031760 [Nucella lapillus]
MLVCARAYLLVCPYACIPVYSSVRAFESQQPPFPKWWAESWSRSAVAGQMGKFVGERPMFPPCRETPTKKETFHFEERPLKYLKTSKNPCWYEEKKTGFKALRCVPYFYMAGVAKGATTDFFRRLRLHPEIFHGTEKEYHWWERTRYGYRDPDDTDKSEAKIGDFSPSYFWDPQSWYVLDGNQACLEPRVIVSQHIRHVYPAARIIFTFRHPTSRFFSRFLSRIPHSPELKGSKPEDLHKLVMQAVQNYKKCFRAWSVRHCAYNDTLYKETPIRLMEGMYPVFMADWLKVWARKQMFFIRYEDYGAHERRVIKEAVAFLGLSPLNSTAMENVMRFLPMNAGGKEYQKFGSMLDKTKKLLDDFYQPFVDQFADMLGDERFRWKDVAH